MSSESIGGSFESHSDVDSVEIYDECVTVMFNMDITPEEAKTIVEKIVYADHGLTLHETVEITVLPDSVKFEDDELNIFQHALIIEVL